MDISNLVTYDPYVQTLSNEGMTTLSLYLEPITCARVRCMVGMNNVFGPYFDSYSPGKIGMKVDFNVSFFFIFLSLIKAHPIMV